MIRHVAANHRGFPRIEFDEAFNVVLAERTRESTRRDSRNGLGKTTLLEVIHFGLGARRGSLSRLPADHLHDWVFELGLRTSGRELIAHRSVASPSETVVTGDTTGLPTGEAEPGEDELRLSTGEWTDILGRLVFGLPPAGAAAYQPSFRLLISYFARLGRDAYASPFDFHRRQREVDRQVANAYLLRLPWEDASEWQRLKDRKEAIAGLKRAASTGLVNRLIGTPGELRAELVRAQSRASSLQAQLASFVVHPQYAEIQRRADALTAQIHEAVNQNVGDTRLLEHYRDALGGEVTPEPAQLEQIYQEVGVVFPEALVRRLDDARNFHTEVVANRQQFVAAEVSRLASSIETRNREVERLTAERASLLVVLRTHGALDEYAALQTQLVAASGVVDELERRMTNLREIDEAESEIRVEQEVHYQRAELHHSASQGELNRAIAIFNSNSEALYDAPGNLVVDVQPTGFKFNVEILRSQSQGITSMKVFCYDLMLAELWAERGAGPGFLVHDSTIFEGVDERQVALALELAARKSREFGFQYICMMNSDSVPRSEFSPNFDFDDAIRWRLTDREESGSLLGFRY